MTRFHNFDRCPSNSLITRDLKSIDYCDSFMIIKSIDDSIDAVTSKLLTLPRWINILLKIRYYLIVKPFSLATGTKKDVINDTNMIYKPIPIIERNENEIVMGEDDKHLYFRISIMKKESRLGTEIYLTTIVKSIIFGEEFIFSL